MWVRIIGLKIIFQNSNLPSSTLKWAPPPAGTCAVFNFQPQTGKKQRRSHLKSESRPQPQVQHMMPKWLLNKISLHYVKRVYSCISFRTVGWICNTESTGRSFDHHERILNNVANKTHFHGWLHGVFFSHLKMTQCVLSASKLSQTLHYICKSQLKTAQTPLAGNGGL